MKARVLLATLLLLAGGCSSLLPEGRQRTVSHWRSFEEARAAYDQIRIGETDMQTVQRLGIDPEKRANVEILNFSQVADRVLPGATSPDSSLTPPGVRSCIEAAERCKGYAVDEQHIRQKRVGGFWSDFLNFPRETHVTGWRFQALVVVVDGVVVFKQWSGQPRISEVQVRRNPLGPLQGAGESAVSLPR